ncbi:hypothetical protein Ccrd_003259 [Cynara cardunculus var. scolymus]|uniref:Uncharacterized protein n=1 Tax=Cynara cardunculus var. scolymus TaxID=59895 RepID=A0A103XPS6_CYNCS|nr:hypothetical protein Ccrd_003259 [Cynara cardunculus var. scolymus]
MKITGKTDLPAIISSKVLNFTPDSDLLQKPILRKQVSRKSRNSGGGVRLRRDGVPAGGKRGSRPETPLLRWKFDESKGKEEEEEEKDVDVESEKLQFTEKLLLFHLDIGELPNSVILKMKNLDVIAWKDGTFWLWDDDKLEKLTMGTQPPSPSSMVIALSPFLLPLAAATTAVEPIFRFRFSLFSDLVLDLWSFKVEASKREGV